MRCIRFVLIALTLSPLLFTRGSGQLCRCLDRDLFQRCRSLVPYHFHCNLKLQTQHRVLVLQRTPRSSGACTCTMGRRAAALPIEGPAPAMAPRSPYDPVFNPIISKAVPNTNLQAQNSYTNMQTVSANSNGQVTTYNSNVAAGNSNVYGSGPSADGSTAYGQQGQQQQQQNQQQQQGVSSSSNNRVLVWLAAMHNTGGANGQQPNTNAQQNTGYQNNNQNQMPTINVAAPAPAPAAVTAVNPMVAAVDLAHQQAQTTPQFSLGQDGATIQQPVVTNAQDGVTSGGNQFKVNEYGVILGNVGTGGSVQLSNNGGVTIDPGTAGNLWSLAKQAATLYGRKMML